MSGDIRWVLEVVPNASSCFHPLVLDLGGGKGTLRRPLEQRGYQYCNLDIQHFENGEPSIIGDAHHLPFKDGVFDLVVSKDTLEHFVQPQLVVQEVYRILKKGGLFVVWVPFIHPFHGDDFYRYTPLGLRYLLKDFQIIHFDSPLWVFTIVGLALIELLKRFRLGFLEKPVKNFCHWLDGHFTQHQNRPASFANAYRIVAKKAKVG